MFGTAPACFWLISYPLEPVIGLFTADIVAQTTVTGIDWTNLIGSAGYPVASAVALFLTVKELMKNQQEQHKEQIKGKDGHIDLLTNELKAEREFRVTTLMGLITSSNSVQQQALAAIAKIERRHEVGEDGC